MRPSFAIETRARAIAQGLPKRQLGGFKGSRIWHVLASWKNRRVVDQATLELARAKQFPNRETRQQRRAEIRAA